jgi:putative endonuclease
MFYTYILYSEKYDRFYVGHCEDIVARLMRHNNKGVPSTRPYAPWQIVYYETYNSRAEASARELAIKKKKSRKYIERLAKGGEIGRHVPIKYRDSQ